MLQNFRFAHYRFTYTVQEPLKMLHHKGNVFRGRFGYILRHITCIETTRERLNGRIDGLSERIEGIEEDNHVVNDFDCGSSWYSANDYTDWRCSDEFYFCSRRRLYSE